MFEALAFLGFAMLCKELVVFLESRESKKHEQESLPESLQETLQETQLA